MSAAPQASRRVVAVGCDIQAHGPVAEAIEAFGPAYLRRVLHPQERVGLDAPAEGAAPDPELTARVALLVALKETVMKCLDLSASDPISWTDIRCAPIRRRSSAGGTGSEEQTAHRVQLHGSAALLARRRGIRSFLAVASTTVPAARTAQTGETVVLSATARAVALSGRSPGGRIEAGTAPGTLDASRRPGDAAKCRSAVRGMPAGAQHRGTGNPHGDVLPAEGLRAEVAAAPAQQGDPSGPPEESGRSRMSSTEEIIAEVRQVVAQHAHLARDAGSLAESDSLYAAGMTSHASVNVMLGVEDAFDLEFPEQMLTKETFESLESIAAAVRTLEEQQ